MKKKIKQITVTEKGAKERLDVFLTSEIKQSRSKIQKMIKEGQIKINGVASKKNGQLLDSQDIIEISELEEKKDNRKIPKNKQFYLKDIKIIADTKDYVVVEKPSGLLTHPTEANEDETLATFLQHKYPAIKKLPPDTDRPGIVHRLDRGASGILVVAKTKKMYEHLKKQFQNRTVEKKYIVLVHGKMAKKVGKINFKIDRGPDGKMVARPVMKNLTLKNVTGLQNGKDALTEFEVIKEYARFSLLNVKIHTGRTHQIRVHMQAFNHPVVGDMLYYNRKLNRKKDSKLGRIFLHATKLGFVDLEGKDQSFQIGLPKKLQSFLEELS